MSMMDMPFFLEDGRNRDWPSMPLLYQRPIHGHESVE